PQALEAFAPGAEIMCRCDGVERHEADIVTVMRVAVARIAEPGKKKWRVGHAVGSGISPQARLPSEVYTNGPPCNRIPEADHRPRQGGEADDAAGLFLGGL